MKTAILKDVVSASAATLLITLLSNLVHSSDGREVRTPVKRVGQHECRNQSETDSCAQGKLIFTIGVLLSVTTRLGTVRML